METWVFGIGRVVGGAKRRWERKGGNGGGQGGRRKNEGRVEKDGKNGRGKQMERQTRHLFGKSMIFVLVII